MQVTFAKAKLKKVCESDAKLRGEYGPRMAQLIRQRITLLQVTANLEGLRGLPGRCHDLVGDLKGCLALDLVHPDRLVFRPTNTPLPVDEHGRLNWSEVTEVEIVDIIDYH